MTNRLPVYAISHGGGPWPWINDLMPVDWAPLEALVERNGLDTADLDEVVWGTSARAAIALGDAGGTLDPMEAVHPGSTGAHGI